MHQFATGGPKPFQLTDCRNDHRRDLGTTVRPVACRIRRRDPAEVGGAVCGRDRAAVGVSDLRGPERPDADRADPPRCLFVPADQCGDDPAAGRDHHPRSLAGDSGATARQGRRTAARPDRQPVLRHRSVAGGGGCHCRQYHARPWSRQAVFRADASGDREFAEHCPCLCQ